MQRDGKSQGIVPGPEHPDLTRDARPQFSDERRCRLCDIDVRDVTRPSREALR